jgi:hypothetical protein
MCRGVNVYDLRCGVGLFLVIGAYKLAGAYASRLTGAAGGPSGWPVGCCRR